MNKKTKIQMSIGIGVVVGITSIFMLHKNTTPISETPVVQKINNEVQGVKTQEDENSQLLEITKRIETIPQECIDSNDECDPDSVDERDVLIARTLLKYPPRLDLEPYDRNLLPSKPNIEESNSSTYGTDENSNGVRDDMEYIIVDNYGEDKQLVEAMFAGQRVFQESLRIAEVEQFDDETLKELDHNSSLYLGCEHYYYMTSSEYFDARIDKDAKWYIDTNKILDVNSNTYERAQLRKKLGRQFHGKVSPYVETNLEICQEFFLKSQTLWK